MRLNKKNRSFKVGKNIQLKMVGDIFLNDNELITFKDKKKEFDITKKNWGYYATPSIDKRLKNNGYSTAIIRNKKTKNIFVVLVEKNKKKLFLKYIKDENIKVVKWLYE